MDQLRLCAGGTTVPAIQLARAIPHDTDGIAGLPIPNRIRIRELEAATQLLDVIRYARCGIWRPRTPASGGCMSMCRWRIRRYRMCWQFSSESGAAHDGGLAESLNRYRGEPPHEALGNLTPHEYLMANYRDPLILDGPS